MVNKDINPENNALENMIKSLTKEYERLQDMKLLRLEELWWILDNSNLQILLTPYHEFSVFFWIIFGFGESGEKWIMIFRIGVL